MGISHEALKQFLALPFKYLIHGGIHIRQI